ncbi:DUF167 domain-containing protein [Deferribacterales bacterium RsTz2092]|nr:hypothetical protein AGMMS49941_07050 [Deferribacterales bacterium]
MSLDKIKFSLYIQPGAKNTELAGKHGGLMKLRISAPPVEGAANKAVVEFVAGFLELPKSAVHIVSGEKSRTKTIELTTNNEKVKDKLSKLIGGYL